jgi:hypothetical protein
MGWFHLLDEDGREWVESVDNLFAAEMEEEEQQLADDEDLEDVDGFEMHPLYQKSFSFTIWLDQLLEELGPDIQNHPAGVKLSAQSAIASAKLAAALSDDDVDEIGMTIAYLKRALKATTNAMDAALHLHRETPLPEERHATLFRRLFQIRDGIIALMGEYRAGWRSGHGEE